MLLHLTSGREGPVQQHTGHTLNPSRMLLLFLHLHFRDSLDFIFLHFNGLSVLEGVLATKCSGSVAGHLWVI